MLIILRYFALGLTFVAVDIKSKLGSLGGKPLDKLKQMYFSLEDRYYQVLDKINMRVPVYKIVDPIDKVFPSFVLLIVIVLLAILLLAFFPSFFPSFAMPAEFRAVVKVTDLSGKVLEGATISLSSELFDRDISESTDAWGEARVGIPEEEITVTMRVSKEGFETEEKETVLLAGQTKTIKLKPEEIEFQQITQKTIILVNAKTGQTLSVSASLDFSCSSGNAAPPTQTRSDGTFKVTPPAAVVCLQQAPRPMALRAEAG
jgi:hypothetical protein